jgi:enoyl-CoA hydratase
MRLLEGSAMIERNIDDGILWLRLAHKKANVLDIELLEALLHELNENDDAVRAVILTGTGSIFSAGVDLVRLTQEGAPYVQRFLPLLSRTLRALFAFPKPIVAATNGHAIAGGCILVLGCDVRLMAEGKGRIGVTELLVGVPFPSAALETVRFAVPRDKLQELVYSGRTLEPAEARASGFVDEVVSPTDLLPRAQAIARQLAKVPSEAFRLTKQYLRAEALARMDASKANDAAALTVWSAPETHARIREYMARTVQR